MARRAAIALALAAVLLWCCLLFGIGLDDLADGHTRPGVILSIVVLSLLIVGLCYGVWRFARPLFQATARRY